jgi:hypothetical protein
MCTLTVLSSDLKYIGDVFDGLELSLAIIGPPENIWTEEG